MRSISSPKFSVSPREVAHQAAEELLFAVSGTISSGSRRVNTVSFAWHFVLFAFSFLFCLLRRLSEKVDSPLGLL